MYSPRPPLVSFWKGITSMAKSKLPDEADYEELLSENGLTEDNIEAVCLRLKTDKGGIIHWHYVNEDQMMKWEPMR